MTHKIEVQRTSRASSRTTSRRTVFTRLPNCSPTPNLDHNCCPLRAGRGTLKLAIHRATGLRADTFTKTDAYVKIFYDAVYEETATVMDDNDPVWNATYDFGSVSLGHQLHFEVWDRDVLYNDMAGRCVVFPRGDSRAELPAEPRRAVLQLHHRVRPPPHGLQVRTILAERRVSDDVCAGLV
ncbi:hypothetical protein CRUP_014351 [Coryphaenoides rupestris]|nr:hypothetical protein CRUP_014351 [Coryphaenoides rupestris]